MNSKYNLDLQTNIDFKVKENHWLPKLFGPKYIAFGKTLYCSEQCQIVPKHEYLHIAQFKAYGTFIVVMKYLFHFFRNFIRFKDARKAYAEIPFEIEAREYESGKS